MKLICIPYAGGTRQAYRGLKPYIDRHIEMVTLELPGRGSRSQEDLISSLDLMAEDLYRQITTMDLAEYVLFGHSMGAMLGDLLLHKLDKSKKALPHFFIVTGCPSPIRRGLRAKLSLLNDTEFKSILGRLGGLPDQALKSLELINYILPIVRSDMKAIDSSSYINRGKYDVPVHVFAGTHEGLTDKDLSTWQLETTGDFVFEYLSGGHFFINQHFEYLGKFINSSILNIVNKTSNNISV